MSLDRRSIGRLLDQLPAMPGIKERGVVVPSVDGSKFQEPSPGYAMWSWRDIESADRLDSTYLFNDVDGAAVFLSIVVDADGCIKEIELWRGDAKPVQRVPLVAELVEARPGQVYGE